MRILSSSQWDGFYRTMWREGLAHLSKAERGKLVQGCRGKTIFDSVEEARLMLRVIQPSGKLRIGAYSCPLCHHVHIAERRLLAVYRRYSPSDQPDQPATISQSGS
jgi:hypothetical protein